MSFDEDDSMFDLVWVDHDYTPLPRNYETCPACMQTRTLTHHCQPVMRPPELWTHLVHDHVGGDW